MKFGGCLFQLVRPTSMKLLIFLKSNQCKAKQKKCNASNEYKAEHLHVLLLRLIFIITLLWSYFLLAVCALQCEFWLVFEMARSFISIFRFSPPVSRSPPLPFTPHFFHCSASMLHGILGNYANTAFVRDEDTAWVTGSFLETALITLVHCYQLSFFIVNNIILDASSGYGVWSCLEVNSVFWVKAGLVSIVK